MSKGQNTEEKIYNFFLVIGIATAIVLVTILLILPICNSIFGDSVSIAYSWHNDNTVKVKAVTRQFVPSGYSVYAFSVVPQRDEETNIYKIPNKTEWSFIGSFKGPAYLSGLKHVELLKVVCLRTGTDPKTVFVEHDQSFDTSMIDNLVVEIECH